jgi:hypothetical protein
MSLLPQARRTCGNNDEEIRVNLRQCNRDDTVAAVMSKLRGLRIRGTKISMIMKHPSWDGYNYHVVKNRYYT